MNKCYQKMSEKKYPKILIIGQYFNTRSGGGITLSNLFNGWDKDRIAVAAENIYNPNLAVCNKYYQLGTSETKRKFPFNLKRWGKPVESGDVLKNHVPISLSDTRNIKNSKLMDLYFRLLFFTGLIHYKQRFIISNEFLNWIKEYSPDYIYSQLSALELIRLVNDLNKKLKLPVAIHIMDDWPHSIYKGYISKLLWQKIINKEFLNLLSDAKLLFSISEAMSEEYLKRYHLRFIPFHNPVELKNHSLVYKINYDLDGPFKILYSGRIGLGIKNCLLEIAYAIQSLTLKGIKIEFHIQSTNYNPLLNKLLKFEFIKLNDMAPYSELISIFAKYDLLVIPNDFDKESRKFLRFSMPTKASEYMVSGTPILLYSSYETAVTQHALKNNWAYVVSEKNKLKLSSALHELYEKTDLRIELGKTARRYALEHFDADKIREQFRNSFILD
jgi:glycosyltransferase involved in cell wall biosynthesis